MSIKDYLQPYIKPTLEGAGGVSGGVLAAPANIIAPGVAEALGIGLGVTGGAKLGDIINNYMNGKDAEPLSESLPETAKDVAYNTGLSMIPGEIGGGIKDQIGKPLLRGIWKDIINQSKDLPEMIVRPTAEYKANVKGGLDNAGNLNRSNEMFSKMMDKYNTTMKSKTPIYEQAGFEGVEAPQNSIQDVLDYISKQKDTPNLTPDEFKDLQNLETTAKRAAAGDNLGLQINSEYGDNPGLAERVRQGMINSCQMKDVSPSSIQPGQIDKFKNALRNYKNKTNIGQDTTYTARKSIIDPQMAEVYGKGWLKANKNISTAEGIGEEGTLQPKNLPTGEGNNAVIPKSPEVSVAKLTNKDVYYDLSNKDLGGNDADALRQFSDAIDYENLPDDIKTQLLAKQVLGSKAFSGFAGRMAGKSAAELAMPMSAAAKVGVLATGAKPLNFALRQFGNVYRPMSSIVNNIPLAEGIATAGQESRDNKKDNDFEPVKDKDFEPVE